VSIASAWDTEGWKMDWIDLPTELAFYCHSLMTTTWLDGMREGRRERENRAPLHILLLPTDC
jgi:hypothetical protein